MVVIKDESGITDVPSHAASSCLSFAKLSLLAQTSTTRAMFPNGSRYVQDADLLKSGVVILEGGTCDLD